MVPNNSKNILQNAIKDPASVYATPHDVVRDDRTTHAEKVKILENWALDQKRLLTSEAENMGEDVETENPAVLLQEISKAKEAL